MTIRPELIEEILKECPDPKSLLGEGGLMKELTKALVERCLESEMQVHLADPKYEQSTKARSNRRNGHSQKTIKGEFGEIPIEVPRDRQGEFEPQLVKKRQTYLEGFDEKVIALYGRGMTVRDIQAQLQDLYGVEVSPGLISQITDGVVDEVKEWQSRPLESVYPIVWLDALVVKVRENARVVNKSS